MPPGKEPVEQRRADAADVQIARRAGSKTCADHEAFAFSLSSSVTAWTKRQLCKIAEQPGMALRGLADRTSSCQPTATARQCRLKTGPVGQTPRARPP